MFNLKTITLIAAAAFQLASATDRGLSWATNNDFGPTIGSKPLIKWYHHWEHGIVPQMPKKLEFVPMFWGPKKWGKWNERKAEMNKHWPKNLLGFNEVDVPSQSGMNPDYAVQVWMQEIHPYGKKGVKLGSPAIVYDQNWMADFLKKLNQRGGWVDFIQIHWYGSHRDIAGFKKFVTSTRSRFGKDIWITELGITTQSNGSPQQIKNFMMQAFTWLDTLGYVKRASWFGCFQSNQPPDNYATGKNALFKTYNALSDLGYWYGYSKFPDRRRELIEGKMDVSKRQSDEDVVEKRVSSFQSKHRRDHSRLAVVARQMNMKREEEVEERDEVEERADPTAVDCDEICQKREASIKSWEDSEAAKREEQQS